MNDSGVMKRSAAAGLALALMLGGVTPLAAEPPAAVEPSRTASRPPGVLTLEQAVTLTLQGNREVRNAALEVAKAEDELRSYRTQGLPQFNLYAIGTQALQDINVRVPEGALGDFPGAPGMRCPAPPHIVPCSVS